MALDKPHKSAKRKATPTTVGEFTILPLTLPKLPGLPEAYTDAKHYLYIKAHAPSNPTPSADRSLFIANVPIDASESNIRQLFAGQLGGSRVESVGFDSAIPGAPTLKRFKDDAGKRDKEGEEGAKRGKKRKRDEDVVAEGIVEDEASALPRIWSGDLQKSGGCAVVVFVDKESKRGALKAVQRVVKEGRTIEWKGGDKGVVGVERYKSHLSLRYPNPTHLLATTTAYLTQYDRVSTSRNRLLAAARAVPDEDGFITVTRGGGRTAPAARVELAEQKKAELEERKKKNGVKDDFYRFQNRERRKEEEMKLRRGFERDRKRVAEMRERRGVVRPED
ncbi:hypothetical protein K458DRAFT_320522 [Lentithecium fluviatile CBS 122367]|uniref:Ribosomal RNA-processing protein 7 n=1 Tax=Lentithecium fluviatile CBS 122367 TaxID=1168545 RepID=A0A6G1IFV6_9PLEO|nr:hypothetical protein K458DRAFT_320522 [Lentithecium fluviatile CBS 122367]